ncbi:hypothetical protein BASA84_001323 [Batrachochytrium salamandrivorans]|nr:hypothetical protein BASA84_001323 [Batrachochytrium salamandrivorans]
MLGVLHRHVSLIGQMHLRLSTGRRTLHSLSVDILTRNIARISSPPYGPYSVQSSHAYILGQGPDRLLIDAGNGHPDLKDALMSHLAVQGARLSGVLLTHFHDGHAGGLDGIVKAMGKNSPTIYCLKSSHPRATRTAHLHHLTDGQVITTLDGSICISTLCTPGHSSDHASFWFADEGILFPGDAIQCRPTALINGARAVFQDLTAYRASLAKLQLVVPRLVFPAHGEVVINSLHLIDQALERQNQMAKEIVSIVRHATNQSDGSGGISTQDVIDTFVESCYKPTRCDAMDASRLATDAMVISGTIRQHLLLLESRGILCRRSVVYSPSKRSEKGIDPSKIKGPGGLTMDAIFNHVQESRRRDWKNANDGSPRMTADAAAAAAVAGSSEYLSHGLIHPLHANVKLGFNVVWGMA